MAAPCSSKTSICTHRTTHTSEDHSLNKHHQEYPKFKTEQADAAVRIQMCVHIVSIFSAEWVPIDTDDFS
jgi:hypothetical protein